MMEGEQLGWKAEYRRRDALFLRFVMEVWWQVAARLPTDALEQAVCAVETAAMAFVQRCEPPGITHNVWRH